MSKESSKLWFGLILGMAVGVLITRRSLKKHRMPNAKIWQRILSEVDGPFEAATQISRAQQRYDVLISQSGVLENKALHSHLTENILPMLALYQSWRADGLDQETALTKVDSLYETHYTTYKKGLWIMKGILKALPGGFETFKHLVRRIMDAGFPSPGFELKYLPDNDRVFGFDIQRCFYLDVVTYFGAPELTPSFCKVDNITMENLPVEIKWTRSSTLAMGGPCCDFRWEYIPNGIIPIDQVE